MADKRLDQENVLTDFDYALIVKGSDVAKISKADLASVVGGQLPKPVLKTTGPCTYRLFRAARWVRTTTEVSYASEYQVAKITLGCTLTDGNNVSIHKLVDGKITSAVQFGYKIDGSYINVYMNIKQDAGTNINPIINGYENPVKEAVDWLSVTEIKMQV